jgi:hypothetical protein
MATRSISGIALLLAAITVTLPNATAAEQPRIALNRSDPTVETASSIRTDRLSPKQLRVCDFGTLIRPTSEL